VVPQTAYLGHDNSVNMQITVDDEPFPLTNVTQVKLVFGSYTFTSTNQVSDPIRWLGEGYLTGEVRLFLGAESITPGTYSAATLVMYLVPFTNGIVCESFPLRVVAEI